MRRTLRIFAWALGGSALLALLLGGGMLVAGNTDAGRRMIERLTLELTSGHVSLSGLNGSFPQRLTLERLELRDAGGVWLTADEVSVDWSPLALLERRIQVGSLHAAGVDMERLPQSSSNPASTGPASIPRIDVASLSVDRVKLGAALAGKAATLRLRGNAHLRSAEDMIIEAAARRIDGDGDYELQLRFDPRRMDASLNLHEPAGGPLENVLQLPGLGALAATVKMSGPRTAERLVLSIDAGALHGSARGSLNFNELSADLDFALDSPALAPRSDLSWEHASVHGRWHGSIKSPRADGHIDIGRLRLPGGVQLAASERRAVRRIRKGHAACGHRRTEDSRPSAAVARRRAGHPGCIDAPGFAHAPSRCVGFAPLVLFARGGRDGRTEGGRAQRDGGVAPAESGRAGGVGRAEGAAARW